MAHLPGAGMLAALDGELLPRILAMTTDAATTRYVHNPLGGILSQHDAADAWHWALVDGLGSVRGMVDDTFGVEGARGFAPYGLPMDGAGSVTLPFAFTGEPRDGNGLQYHRARYYNPMVGVFPSLDPLEMGNRYAYVGGNVVNRVDPSGMIGEQPSICGEGSWLVGTDDCAVIVASVINANTVLDRSVDVCAYRTDRWGDDSWTFLTPARFSCLHSGDQIEVFQGPLIILTKPTLQSWYPGSSFSVNTNRFRNLYAVTSRSLLHITDHAIYGVSNDELTHEASQWQIDFGTEFRSESGDCYIGGSESPTDYAVTATFHHDSYGGQDLLLSIPYRRCSVASTLCLEDYYAEIGTMRRGELKQYLVPDPRDCDVKAAIDRLFRLNDFGVIGDIEMFQCQQWYSGNYPACDALSDAQRRLVTRLLNIRCAGSMFDMALGPQDPMVSLLWEAFVGYGWNDAASDASASTRQECTLTQELNNIRRIYESGCAVRA